MVYIWYNLAVIVCIIAEITAAPLRLAPQDNSDLEIKTEVRTTPTVVTTPTTEIPSDCSEGRFFYFIDVKYCAVANAKYSRSRDICLEKLLHVPGMTDGDKGGDYLCIDEFLYRSYKVLTRKAIKLCPPPTKQQPPNTITATVATVKIAVGTTTPAPTTKANSATTAHRASIGSSRSPTSITKATKATKASTTWAVQRKLTTVALTSASTTKANSATKAHRTSSDSSRSPTSMTTNLSSKSTTKASTTWAVQRKLTTVALTSAPTTKANSATTAQRASSDSTRSPTSMTTNLASKSTTKASTTLPASTTEKSTIQQPTTESNSATTDKGTTQSSNQIGKV